MATAGSEVPRWARLDSPLLREMESAIIVTDLAGTIQSCNPHAEVFFGRPSLRADRARLRRFRRRARAGRARPSRSTTRSGPGARGRASSRSGGRTATIVTAHVVDSPLHDDRGRSGRCGLDGARPDGPPARREPAPRPIRDCPHAGGGALDRRGQRAASPNRVRGARLGRGRAVGTRHRTVGPALPCHLALARQQSGRLRGAQRSDDVPHGHEGCPGASGPGERRHGFRTSPETRTSPVQKLPTRTACTAGSGSPSGAGATCSA